MDALSDVAILAVWELGHSRQAVDQALAMLQHTIGDDEAEQLAIGSRDARLLDVYAATFGSSIEARTACPQCGEELDVAFNVPDIRARGAVPAGQYELIARDPGYHITFRLPCSTDLRAAAGLDDPQEALRVLAERCVASAERNGSPVPAAQLPDEVMDELDQAMARHDPQADVQLNMACPGCGHSWQTGFDIVDFLWRTLARRARQLVVDVHTLATAYGWSETEILWVPPARRQLYLELTS
jgi:T4 bacteriophage base plate protein